MPDTSESAEIHKTNRVNIRPGPSVLSVLKYLNYKPWFALAEFVDNALQSFLDNRRKLAGVDGPDCRLRVDIGFDSAAPGRITIRDNAAGISWADFPRAFRPAVIPPDSHGLSEFGMGMKSASCWFAATWKVRTKALGENVERTVHFDVARIVRDELEELEIGVKPALENEHLTEVVLDNLHHLPVGRTISKIKEHLTDIYRVYVRNGTLDLRLNDDPLVYTEPVVLVAPYAKEPESLQQTWRKEINFEFGGNQRVTGFAALRDPGNFSRSGFALFRRGRLIQGSGDEGYRPPVIFGTSSGSYRHLRLFGELHLDGFEVSHTKDGFRWDENEEPFLDLLKEHLDSDELPLLKQCDLYRSLASKRDRAKAAEQALARTSDAIMEHLPEVLPGVADGALVETPHAPLIPQPVLAQRELRFNFRGNPWRVRVELSDDPAESEWLSISNQAASVNTPETLEIRVSMAHPFMISFAQTNPSDIDALVRIAAALALAETLARRAGVKYAGTVRRNVNEILREALSQP